MADSKGKRKRIVFTSDSDPSPESEESDLNTSDERLVRERLEEVERRRAAGEFPASQPKNNKSDSDSDLSDIPLPPSINISNSRDNLEERMREAKRIHGTNMDFSLICPTKKTKKKAKAPNWALPVPERDGPTPVPNVRKKAKRHSSAKQPAATIIPNKSKTQKSPDKANASSPPHSPVAEVETHSDGYEGMDESDELQISSAPAPGKTSTPFTGTKKRHSLNPTAIGISPVPNAADVRHVIMTSKKTTKNMSRIPKPRTHIPTPPPQKLNLRKGLGLPISGRKRSSVIKLPPRLTAKFSPIQDAGNSGSEEDSEDEGEPEPTPAANATFTPVKAPRKSGKNESKSRTQDKNLTQTKATPTSNKVRPSQVPHVDPIESQGDDNDHSESAESSEEEQPPVAASAARKSGTFTMEPVRKISLDPKTKSLASPLRKSRSEQKKRDSTPVRSQVSQSPQRSPTQMSTSLSPSSSVNRVTRLSSKPMSTLYEPRERVVPKSKRQRLSQDSVDMPSRRSSSKKSKSRTSEQVEQTTAQNATFAIPNAPAVNRGTARASSADKRKSVAPLAKKQASASTSAAKTGSVPEPVRSSSNKSGNSSQPNVSIDSPRERPGPKSVKERRLAEKSARMSTSVGIASFTNPSLMTSDDDTPATGGAPNSGQVSNVGNSTFSVPPPTSTNTSLRRKPMPKSVAERLAQSDTASSLASTSVIEVLASGSEESVAVVDLITDTESPSRFRDRSVVVRSDSIVLHDHWKRLSSGGSSVTSQGSEVSTGDKENAGGSQKKSVAGAGTQPIAASNQQTSEIPQSQGPVAAVNSVEPVQRPSPLQVEQQPQAISTRVTRTPRMSTGGKNLAQRNQPPPATENSSPARRPPPRQKSTRRTQGEPPANAGSASVAAPDGVRRSPRKRGTTDIAPELATSQAEAPPAAGPSRAPKRKAKDPPKESARGTRTSKRLKGAPSAPTPPVEEPMSPPVENEIPEEEEMEGETEVIPVPNNAALPKKRGRKKKVSQRQQSPRQVIPPSVDQSADVEELRNDPVVENLDEMSEEEMERETEVIPIPVPKKAASPKKRGRKKKVSQRRQSPRQVIPPSVEQSAVVDELRNDPLAENLDEMSEEEMERETEVIPVPNKAASPKKRGRKKKVSEPRRSPRKVIPPPVEETFNPSTSLAISIRKDSAVAGSSRNSAAAQAFDALVNRRLTYTSNGQDGSQNSGGKKSVPSSKETSARSSLAAKKKNTSKSQSKTSSFTSSQQSSIPPSIPGPSRSRMSYFSTTMTRPLSAVSTPTSNKPDWKRDTTPIRYTGKDVFGNYHMLKVNKVRELLDKNQPEHDLMDHQVRKVALKVNHFLEDFFGHLCDNTNQGNGFVTFKQLMALLKQQHLIPKNSTPEDLMLSMKSQFSKEDWKKNEGVLYPHRNSNDMDTASYFLE